MPVSVGRPQLRIWAHGLETAVLLPLVLLFGWEWGVTGAAVAILVSTGAFVALWSVFILRLRGEVGDPEAGVEHPLDEQDQEEPGGHDTGVDQEGQRQTGVLSQDELEAVDRLGQERVHRPPLDLPAHQADADEHRRQDAEDVDCGKAEILDDLLLAPDRQERQDLREGDHDHREHKEEVEDAVPDGLAERVERDRVNPGEHGLRRAARAALRRPAPP